MSRNSMAQTSYLVPPPSYPTFMFKFFAPRLLKELIEWAKKEHHARLRWCAENGYYRELKRLNEDYSPIRVLAEIEGYRKICANISQKGWDSLTGRERVFVRRAFEMRNLLLTR